MKRCARCGEDKPASEFGVKNPKTGTLNSFCRPCVRANSKAHYEANKTSYIARAKNARVGVRARNMVLVVEYLRAHPCVDCGNSDVRVLEFDHIRDKAFDVSAKLSDYSWSTLLKEIAKCEVVCANCHRRRTARRGGFVRSLIAEAL
ncbi:MAG: hypothetical protein Q8K63_06465 [Acidimicrobiales bacterium]|nr:hypothetical protein [Acidimicrobiales bacterium]